MANTIKLGTDGNWAVKENNLLAYNDENNIFKPIDFNFTRDSGATRVNKEGLIEVVSNNEPRIDFLNDSKGALLLEPSRTNLIPSNVSDWVVFQSNVTQSNQSPDGYNNAIKITSNAVVNSGVYFSGLSVSGNTEIFTIWLKGENGGEILEIGDATNRTTVTLTNEWVRYEAKAISASAFKILYNQTTNPIVQTWYAWGPQLEDNVSYATSYIPTQGSVATRVAETCSQTTPSGIIGQTEGVLYAEFQGLSESVGNKVISLNDGTNNNAFWLYIISSSNGIRIYDGVTIGSFFPVNAYENNKFALVYNSTNTRLFINGSLAITIPFKSMSNLNKLSFSDGNGGQKFEGKVKDVRVYNTALTDAELQALTQV